ncbi:MAG: hypothetical protein JRI81_11480 [Deltaproteobacteria bacterium]|nr:hypothetical protein [Deltaproteobacteria bacterium]
MDDVTSTESPSPETVSACKAITTSLLLAVKMHSMYSPEHVNCQEALGRLQNELDTFLREHEDLRLEVEKDRLLYGGEVVYKGAVKDGDIAFALFRDGMLDITFQKGIEVDETNALVKILHHYKSLSGDAEGDIVTALWEGRLPHIKYNAAEHILDSESDADTITQDDRKKQLLNSIEQKSITPSGALDVRMIAEELLIGSQQLKEFQEIDFSSLELSEEEALKLRDLVKEEEERDTTGEVLEMAADILRGTENEALFEAILVYLEEQLVGSFKHKDLSASFRILKGMRQIGKLSEEKRPWALPLIKDFFKRISEEKSLSRLGDVLATEEKHQIKKAGTVLLLLPPEAIGALSSMIHTASSPGQKALLKAIVVLAGRDLDKFEEVLERADEVTALRLVGLLRLMEDQKVAEVLVRITRHSSEAVRKEAFKIIVEQKLWIPEKIMNLIEDQSISIRNAFIRYLGTRRSEPAAERLVEYLRSHKFGINEDNYLLACFEALGRCGTEKSIPFLEQTLLGGSWFSKWRSSARRRGAALALSEIGTDQAKKILKLASSSLYPGLKEAAGSVMKKRRGPGAHK